MIDVSGYGCGSRAFIPLCHARFHHLHELIHGREHLRGRRQSNQSNGSVHLCFIELLILYVP
jgi:hypothetical protein